MFSRRRPSEQTEMGLRALAERLTYKPGWKIDYIDDRTFCLTSPRLEPAPDTRHMAPGDTVTLQKSFAVPAECPQESLIVYIRAALAAIELHEMDEWLRLDGQCLLAPHPEIRNHI